MSTQSVQNTFKPELLLPAGNMDKFNTAVLYGADAVYLGGQNFNLRASCAGFTGQELQTAVNKAYERKIKVYYCLNSFPQPNELENLPAAIEEAASCGVHAFIIADPGVLRMVRKYAPGTQVHLSTQANTTNAEAIAFWLDAGAVRVNLARELDSHAIASIRSKLPQTELEIFAHGAMCLAISGQCLLSAWLNNRPANQGRCTHPCRFEYRAIGLEKLNPVELMVEEAKRPGEEIWRVGQDEKYSSFWAPQDLCLLPYLPWFFTQKINALKIEGRMKSSAYVANVADAYSTALRAAAKTSGEAKTEPENTEFDFSAYLQELTYLSARPLGTGFFLTERKIWAEKNTLPGHSVLARVLEPAQGKAGTWSLEVQGNWKSGQNIELMLPGLQRPVLAKHDYALENHRGELEQNLGCGSKGTLHCSHPEIIPGIFIRSAD
jgi:putative protease